MTDGQNETPVNNPTISEIYKHIDITDSCLAVLEDLKPLADETGLFNLNAAIKEDIAKKYESHRVWVAAMISKLVKAGLVEDLTMGRYRIVMDHHVLDLITHIKNGELEEVIFEIKLRPKENTKALHLISFH